MLLDLVFEFIVICFEKPKSLFRLVTGRGTTNDWVEYGWRRGSRSVSASELADIETRASRQSAQSRIDDILHAQNRPLRGAKENPWGDKG